MRKLIYVLLICFMMGISGFAYSGLPYYGPTVESDHLYRIALRVRPSPAFTIQQFMVALFDLNPRAFNCQNINGLKAGYCLRLPSLDSVACIKPEVAFRIVEEHNRLWECGSVRPTEVVTQFRKHELHPAQVIKTYPVKSHHVQTIKPLPVKKPHAPIIKMHPVKSHAPVIKTHPIKSHAPVTKAPAVKSRAQVIKTHTVTPQQSNNATKKPIKKVPKPVIKKEPASDIPSIENAKEEKVTLNQNSNNSKSSLLEIAGEQSTPSNTMIKLDKTLSANPDPKSQATSSADIPTIDSKVTTLSNETKQFEEQTNLQIARLQQQTNTLEAKVNQLNEELRTLTYHFIQLTGKNIHNKSEYTKALMQGLKQTRWSLVAGVLALILLTYMLLRSFRAKPRKYRENSKKDDYDFMSSAESMPSKLDLARAYIDMGDNDSAKSTLKEVMARGNADQKRTAQDLLSKLGQ